MKKLNKFFASALALSMAVSCFTISAFAKDSVATMTVNTAEGLAVGDTVVATIKIDSSTGYAGISYKLLFDKDVFELDKSQKETAVNKWDPEANDGAGGVVSESKYVEAYIDGNWFFNTAKTNNALGGTLSQVTYSPTTEVDLVAGQISFSYAGTSAVTADGSNKIIGKFNLKVKALPTNGTSTLTLAGTTVDGSNVKGTLSCNDQALKFTNYVDEPETAVATTVGATETYENGTLKNVGVKATSVAVKSTSTGIKLYATIAGDTEASHNGEKTFNIPFATYFSGLTFESDANVNIGINVNAVPAGVSFTATAAEAY